MKAKDEEEGPGGSMS